MNDYTPSSNLPVRAVIIDDEEWFLEMMELAIPKKFKNFDLQAFQDSEKAWLELAQRDPDLLITGANMGKLSGEEIVRRLIEKKVAYPILVVSGWVPTRTWVQTFATKKPNISFLQKPFTTEQLYSEISKLLGHGDIQRLNVIGLCPRCGSEVLEGSSGYFCRKKDCRFKISGVVLGQVLVSSQVSKLLQEGRTDLLSGFVSAKGKSFSAWLVMDKNGKVTFDFPNRDSEEDAAENPKPAASSKRHANEECLPLIEAATKDLFRKNAFRITGLQVDATTREVSRHADKLKMLAELGQDQQAQGAAFPISPPPTLDEIREAIQKLKDPEQRLIDEFFWFWPEEFGQSKNDPAIQSLAKGDTKKAMEIWRARDKSSADGVVSAHNIALSHHINALDLENSIISREIDAETRQKITSFWKGAFRRWKYLIKNEQLWGKVSERIRQLNEPTLLTGFARRMRATLPGALDKINAEFAVSFAESGNIEFARLHVEFMREKNQELDNFEKTAEMVLKPVGARLREQIKRARDRGEKESKEAGKIALELLQQSQRTLKLFDLFFDKDNELRNDLFDEVASACNRLQVVYHNETTDDKLCLQILNSVLPIVASYELRQQIEKNITTLGGFAEEKLIAPFFEILKSIQDSKEHPSVRLGKFRNQIANIAGALAGLPHSSQNRKEFSDAITIVLRGISLDAWNNHKDRLTAVAANDLAAKYAVSQEMKQKLAEDKSTLGQMAAAEAAKQKSSNQTGIGCLVVIGIVVVLGIIGSCNSSNSTQNTTSYTPPAQDSPPSPSAPAYTPPPASSGGAVYSVPSSVSATLDTEKAEIESERTAIELLDAQIEKLGREIQNDRLSLDSTSQSAVDDFNAKVDRYNALVQKDKTATAAFNERVDNYNAKLRQYGR